MYNNWNSSMTNGKAWKLRVRRLKYVGYQRRRRIFQYLSRWKEQRLTLDMKSRYAVFFELKHKFFTILQTKRKKENAFLISIIFVRKMKFKSMGSSWEYAETWDVRKPWDESTRFDKGNYSVVRNSLNAIFSQSQLDLFVLDNSFFNVFN